MAFKGRVHLKITNSVLGLLKKIMMKNVDTMKVSWVRCSEDLSIKIQFQHQYCSVCIHNHKISNVELGL